MRRGPRTPSAAAPVMHVIMPVPMVMTMAGRNSCGCASHVRCLSSGTLWRQCTWSCAPAVSLAPASTTAAAAAAAALYRCRCQCCHWILSSSLRRFLVILSSSSSSAELAVILSHYSLTHASFSFSCLSYLVPIRCSILSAVVGVAVSSTQIGDVYESRRDWRQALYQYEMAVATDDHDDPQSVALAAYKAGCIHLWGLNTVRISEHTASRYFGRLL